MIKVTILNPEALEHLYENHGKFACVCYNTPEEKAEGVGKHCQSNNHMSGSRCEYIKFKISGVDRGTAEQCLRHEIGVKVPFDMQDNYNFSEWIDRVENVNPDDIVKNMASFRYIDKDGFDYATPAIIAGYVQAKETYDALMALIRIYRNSIINELTARGVNPKTANEAANFVLPRATTTDFVIGFTPEALIHFCHKRLCLRAQENIRQIAVLMRAAVMDINPRFGQELMPQCHHLLWCPEGKQGCGGYPTKEELKSKLFDMEHKD